jgi:hypothetical protein
MPVRAQAARVPSLKNLSLPPSDAFSFRREKAYASRSFMIYPMASSGRCHVSYMGVLLQMSLLGFAIVLTRFLFLVFIVPDVRAVVSGKMHDLWWVLPLLAAAVFLAAWVYTKVDRGVRLLEGVYIVMYSMIHMPLILFACVAVVGITRSLHALTFSSSVAALAGWILSGYIAKTNMQKETEDPRAAFIVYFSTAITSLILVSIVIMAAFP